MNNSIYPCLTIKGRIQEAADFYIKTFGEGSAGTALPYVMQIQLSGQRFLLLNEGPVSTPNATLSFTVMCKTAEETERYWSRLIEGGSVLMPLDTYEWSSKYGWLQDRFGVHWQLFTAVPDSGQGQDGSFQQNEGRVAWQKFVPSFMFTGKMAGKALDALNYYTRLFPNSSKLMVVNYTEEDGDNSGYIKHGRFSIDGYVMTAMESSMDHGVEFNDAISLVVECDTQDEVDHYWNNLVEGGGEEVACGWLNDRYGIAWQIVPKRLMELLKEPQRAERVMQRLMGMKKLVISELESA